MDVNRVDFGLSELVNCGPTTVYLDCCVISRTSIGTTAVNPTFSHMLLNDTKISLKTKRQSRT